MYDAITIGVPPIAIMFSTLVGILFNRQGLNELKADLQGEIRASEERVTARVLMLERDYRDFYKTQAQLESRLDGMKNS